MKTKTVLIGAVLASILFSTYAVDSTTAPRETVFNTRPLGIKLSVKMVGPYMQAADLQIICAFKHKPSGDTYLGAAKEFDQKVEGILSAMRNRGEFVGELAETILFMPPKGSIPAKRVLVIGLGDEEKLSLDTVRVAGRVAARESVRLKAKHVAWAPVIRDQGNSVLDVGEVDGSFVEQMLLAYDTERRLQAQGLADEFSIEALVIEAGEPYFEGAVRHIGGVLESAAKEIAARDSTPYASKKK
jgi:hypothetical protein